MHRRVLLAAPVALAVPGVVRAQDAASFHPIVGAWWVTAAPPGPQEALAVYEAGGTMSFLTPFPASPFPGSSYALLYQTPAYGAWQESGPRSARIAGVHLHTDESGAFRGTLAFQGTVEVAEDGESYIYAGQFEVTDETGAVLFGDVGETQGTRIHADAMPRMPAAAATPTP